MTPKHILQRENFRSSVIIKRSDSSLLDRHRVRRLVASLIRNNPLQLLFLDKKKDYLNIGCGGNVLKNFINIDFGWVKKQDLCWNILKGFPLSDNSLKGIFIEHTLEHFTMQEIRKILLPEFLRILQPAGTLRISVPDADKAVEEYIAAKNKGLTAPVFEPEDENAKTPMMRLNNTFRQINAPLQFGHKFAFDYQTLEYFLKDAGFAEIKREEYMNGRDENLLVDYKRRADESLYVEAIKSAN